MAMVVLPQARGEGQQGPSAAWSAPRVAWLVSAQSWRGLEPFNDQGLPLVSKLPREEWVTLSGYRASYET